DKYARLNRRFCVTDTYRMSADVIQFRENLTRPVIRGPRRGNEKDRSTWTAHKIFFVRPFLDVRRHSQFLRPLEQFGLAEPRPGYIAFARLAPGKRQIE